MKNKGGRPTKLHEGMNKIANDYLQECIATKDIPYIEELQHKLNVDDDTINEWTKIDNEFSATIKRIKSYQGFMLQKGSIVGKYNPAAAIFQLKANHGMIETEKRILAGDKNEPLQIEFVDEIKRV